MSVLPPPPPEQRQDMYGPEPQWFREVLCWSDGAPVLLGRRREFGAYDDYETFTSYPSYDHYLHKEGGVRFYRLTHADFGL